MRETRLQMGMPIVVDIIDESSPEIFQKVFQYFAAVDARFSTYKPTSEISRFNRGEIREKDFSPEMKEIFRLAEETKKETDGYFNIQTNQGVDPSGIVKGWAINNAAGLIKRAGIHNFYVEAGGDIQVKGKNKEGKKWKIGIRNPFNKDENIKVLQLTNHAVATSGTYERGAHIYNPHDKNAQIKEIVSLTVIGPNIYEADRFATAAFAMGVKGIDFIEQKEGLEGYMIDKRAVATYTNNFNDYLFKDGTTP